MGWRLARLYLEAMLDGIRAKEILSFRMNGALIEIQFDEASEQILRVERDKRLASSIGSSKIPIKRRPEDICFLDIQKRFHHDNKARKMRCPKYRSSINVQRCSLVHKVCGQATT